MRLITGVIIMLIVITIMSIITNHYIITTSNNVHNLLVKIENNIHNNNWQNVLLLNKKLNKKWDKAQNIIPILIDHAELHDLEITLARISSLIQQKNKGKIFAELSIAKKLIKNIQDQEKLNFKNVF